MKRIEIGPDVVLYQGDCLEILPTLEAGSVDAVVTDPPYSSGGQFRGDRTLSTRSKYVMTGALHTRADFSGDNRDQRGWLAWSMVWLGASRRCCKPGGFLAMFTDWRQLPVGTDAVQGGGWVWRGVIPWNKTAAARPQKGWFRAQCEYVITASNGTLGKEQDRDGDCLEGIWSEAVNASERVHQTQKPVDLMRFLVSPAPDGGLVVDPFLGGGTTGVACLRTGRKFIGIEIDEHYFNVARKRIEAEAAQLKMF